MLTIFNRAELLITYDLARFCQVRDALEAAGIDFTYKVRNRTSPTMTASGPTMTASGSRERFGNANIRHDAHMEYRLFVHRDQLDWAQTFLKQ